MALQEQSVNINFSKGLDTKTDPFQLQIGSFLSLQNSIFQKGGLLQKRNGYLELPNLPDASSSYVTTFNGNLTALGQNINAYSAGTMTWVNKGTLHPLDMSVLSLVRNNDGQTQSDSVVAPNNLVCVVYTEIVSGVNFYKYSVIDATTGQNVVNPTFISNANTAFGTPKVFLVHNNFVIVYTSQVVATYHLQYIALNINSLVAGSPVDITTQYTPTTTVSWDGFVANNNLYLAWNGSDGGGAIRLNYLDYSLTLHTPVVFAGYAAAVMSVTVDVTSNTGLVYASFYDSANHNGYTLIVNQALSTVLSPFSWISSVTGIVNITSAAQNGSCTIFFEFNSTYSYTPNNPTHRIQSIIVTPAPATFHAVFGSGVSTITPSSLSGLVNGMYVVDITTPSNIPINDLFTISGSNLLLSSPTNGASASSPGDLMGAVTVSNGPGAARSLGLASKAFLVNNGTTGNVYSNLATFPNPTSVAAGTLGLAQDTGILYQATGSQWLSDQSIYYVGAYQSAYQNTYFLIDGSISNAKNNGATNIVAKFAYENGGGYCPTGLPSVTVDDNTAYLSYLFKDFIQAINTTQGATNSGQPIYTQTGVNLLTLDFSPPEIVSAELGSNLNVSGGIVYAYDGTQVTEQGFNIWPDNIGYTWSTTGGAIHAQPDGATNNGAYFYQVTYEWTDNQGNLFRSAPSIPLAINTTGTGTTGSITLHIPMLRLTYKTTTPVNIVIYRWSVAQQSYYQVTSITAPFKNDVLTDSLDYVDTLADGSILGNNLIYTTGGVVEDIGPPSTSIMTLFDTRLWLVDAEDPNVLWYSKQVIQGTPVEMSDLFTIYISPTQSAQGSTGPITALAAMDDKLVIFKRNAIYYINGTGPDNTGANNQYSQPIFITSTVGCTNENSIVFIPHGLMFQSDKGIWLLGRDLGTTYIGAPVEAFNQYEVMSALNIPGTNQVRFTLSNGTTLMYDYYYNQWGTFVGVPAISSTLYQELHTFINQYGEVFQESPGLYLDGSNPVLMSFTTGWFNLASLQGYERFDSFYLLGTYLSPIYLNVQAAYDYNPSIYHSVMINPNPSLFSSGTPSPFGVPTPFGAPFNKLQYRIFAKRQLCEAFQITINEVFDASLGVTAGAGITLSGLNLIIGIERSYRPIPESKSVG